jgi:glucuronokinase
MSRNLALCRQLLGDAALGRETLAMVEVAASVGAAAKLTGSGGAVVAMCPGGAAQAAALEAACAAAGLVCEAVRVGPVLHTARGDAES